MVIVLKKEDFIYHSAGKRGAKFYSPKDRCTGFTIKKYLDNERGIYSYFLCSRDGIDKDDSIIFTDGELIGCSRQDISKEDVTIVV